MSSNLVGNEIDLCRICLSDSPQRFDLRKKMSSQNISLLKALEGIMNCKISLMKKTPNKICAMCMSLVELTFNFKNRFEKSQQILAENIMQTTIPSEKSSTNDSIPKKNNGNMTEQNNSSETFENNVPAKSGNDLISYLELSQKRSLNDESNTNDDTNKVKIRKIEKPVNQNKKENRVEKIITRENVKTEKPIELQCKFCDFKTDGVFLLRGHIEAQHFGEVLKCKLCEYRTRNKVQLERHLDTNHSTKKHTCEFCKFTAATIDDLEAHIDAVHYTKV